VKSFRRGLADDDETTVGIDHGGAEPVSKTNTDQRAGAG
jgi:hypothetical protein